MKNEVWPTQLEASFNSEHVPGVFWLVFRFSIDDIRGSTAAEYLAQGLLPGLKGISSDKRIILQWLNVARNAVLIMDGDDVVRLNNLTRVMYDNPEYLVSRDLEALYRIFNKDRAESYGRQGLMQVVVDYLIRAVLMDKEGRYNPDLHDFAYQANYGYLSATRFGYHYAEAKPRIRNVRDFSVYLKRAAKDIALEEKRGYLLKVLDNIKLEEWMAVVRDGLKRVGDIYGDEGEWLVKSDTFVVPEGSRLLIMKGSYPRGEFQRQQEEVSRLDLRSRYKVSFLDPLKYQEIQKRLWAARG